MVVLALSVPEEVERIGAYAGVAAFFGLAFVAILYFAQARELKRLREWAGRAPERAAELEARVMADAARRVGVQQVVPRAPGAPATPAAAAAAAQPAAGAAPAPATPAGDEAAAAAAAPDGVPAKAAEGEEAKAPEEAKKPEEPEKEPEEDKEPEEAPAAAQEPATAATNGSGAAAAKPGVPAAVGAQAAAAPPASPPQAAPTPPPAAPTPPADKPAPSIPRATPLPQRTPPPPRRPAPAAPLRSGAPATRRPGSPPPRRPAQPARDEGRGAGRIAALAGGGVIALAALVFGATQLFGGDSEQPAKQNVPVTQSTPDAQPEETPAAGGSTTLSRAETTVAVLNGTTIPGLAATIADRVTQNGFKRGTIDNYTDSARSASLVFYAPEARRRAIEVARLLQLPAGDIQEITPDIQDLAGDAATVVVVVGQDQTP